MKLSPEMNADLRKAVKAFNRKVKRLESKGVTASLLPEKASVKALKNAYKDTESLQERIKFMQSFSSKGEAIRTKKGVVGTPAMFAYRRKENERAKQMLEQQYSKASMQKTKYKSRLKQYKQNLKSRIKYLSKDVENIDVRTVSRQYQNGTNPERLYKQNFVYRQNFYDKVWEYAGIGDTDPKKVKALIRKLNSIPLEDFYRITTSNPEFEEIKNYMFDSPTVRAGKKARPKYDEEDVRQHIDDLLEGIDDIIANSMV